MPRTGRVAALGAVLALVVAVSGCGEDDEGEWIDLAEVLPGT